MSARADLDQYLSQARRRLLNILLSRGAAILLMGLLVASLLGAAALGLLGFDNTIVLLARLVFAAVAASASLLAWRRYRSLQAGDGASALERALPQQGGRIQTYLQEQRKQAGSVSVLLDLLAEDAQHIADQSPLASAIPARRLLIPAGVAVASVAVLAGLLWTDGLIGDATRRLWLGSVPSGQRLAAAAGGIAVTPGDVSVRRNQDLPIAAVVAGSGSDVKMHVQFADSKEWEVAPMEADGKGGFGFTLFAVREAARYYVTAGRLKSAEHQVTVVDLPQIQSLRLTYNYPAWTGLPRRIEESGGDIRAVAGTRVALEIATNAPMQSPLLVINGAQSGLAQAGSVSQGNITVKDPGHYRIATRFGDEIVPLTDDFVIDVVADQKPSVEILRPGRDYQATNIEEVPVSLRAQDDFRLESLALHYSVNGGDWREEKLPAGAADIQAAALLRLEEMQQQGPAGEAPLLVPGDLVSYYAMARDHSSSAQTDLFLIQVAPFERRFTQSQANGGGGGGGGGEEDEGAISKRQREVLLATWNLQRNQTRDEGREKERLADNARMLSEVQKTLAEQANTLVERAKARALTGADETVTTFVKSLEEAAKAMTPAAERLANMNLEDAVKFEQQALQHLLRAESTFREIQVAMQSNSAGGGGGGAQAGRDVAEMTELELDLEKNQYETEPQMTAQQRTQTEDETMRRLRELARRQEQLAREAARRSQPTEQQRWQQEQLRREAEQLRQQLEQLAQQQRGQSQPGGQSQSGQQSASASSAQDAARQLSDAMREMQARNDSASANRASEQLNRAREQLERGRQQAQGERFQNLAETARDLVNRQRTTENELRAAVGGPQPPASIANPRAARSGLGFEQAERLGGQKREIQSGLENLQRQMRQARQQAGERTPRAGEQVGQAAQALEEQETAARLARTALEIERGRGVQAAARDPLISESLQQLQQNLEEAASLAATEVGGSERARAREADASDLLAELGELRQALDRARQQGVAQEGQAGQPGGQQGQGQGHGQPGQQSAQAGGREAGGFGTDGAVGGGGANFGGARGIRQQAQISGQRLAQLRGQLPSGALNEADVSALRELSERLRRGGGDPMSAEYQRMVSLVNQLELAALRSAQASNGQDAVRAADRVDDSGRYRDNVAEYYRRLGGKK